MRKTVYFIFIFNVTILASHALTTSGSKELPIPPILEAQIDGDGQKTFTITAREGTKEFKSGKLTRTYGYNSDYLGPTIRMRQDDNVRMRVQNQLKSGTTVHWHGLVIPADADGGPHSVIPPGATWEPTFKVNQAASTFWYHPHLTGKTAEQVYMGLAGFLIIDDEVSDSLDLPNEYGVNDIPLILQDRDFNISGRFVYRQSMHNVMHGYDGNTLLVNGVISPQKSVKRGLIRLRLLNGSNTSVLKISFTGVDKFYQISSDGGFLQKPVGVNSIILSIGERAEILVDFSTIEDPVRLVAETDDRDVYDGVEFIPHGPISSTNSRQIPEKLATVTRIKPSEARKPTHFQNDFSHGANAYQRKRI